MPRHDRGSGFRGGRQTTQKSWQNGSINFSFPPPRRPTSHLLRSLLPGTSRLTKELSSALLPRPAPSAPRGQVRDWRGNTCTGGREERGCVPGLCAPRRERLVTCCCSAKGGARPSPAPRCPRPSSSSAPPGPGQRCRWAPAASHAWAPSATRLPQVPPREGKEEEGGGGKLGRGGGGRGPAGSRPSDLPHLCLSRLPGRHPEVGQKGGGERGRPPAVPPEPGLGGAGARGTVCKPLPPQLLLGQPPWNAPPPAASPAPRLAPARPLLAGRGGVGRCSGPLGRSRGVSRRGGVGTAAFVWQRWRYAARPGGTGAECGPGRGRRRFAHVNPAIGRGSLILCSLWVLQR